MDVDPDSRSVKAASPSSSYTKSKTSILYQLLQLYEFGLRLDSRIAWNQSMLLSRVIGINFNFL